MSANKALARSRTPNAAETGIGRHRRGVLQRGQDSAPGRTCISTRKGRVVSGKEVSNTLWGVDTGLESGSIDRQVRNLRVRLLDAFGWHDFIATLPGNRYRFLANVSSVASNEPGNATRE